MQTPDRAPSFCSPLGAASASNSPSRCCSVDAYGRILPNHRVKPTFAASFCPSVYVKTDRFKITSFCVAFSEVFEHPEDFDVVFPTTIGFIESNASRRYLFLPLLLNSRFVSFVARSFEPCPDCSLVSSSVDASRRAHTTPDVQPIVDSRARGIVVSWLSLRACHYRFVTAADIWACP